MSTKAWSVSPDGKEFWLLAEKAWIRVYESNFVLRGRTVEVRSNLDVLRELGRCVRGEGHIALFSDNPGADGCWGSGPHASPVCYLYM